MRYTEKSVAQLVADVEKAFTACLSETQSTVLAKSEDGEKDHKEEHKEESGHKEHEDHEEKPEHEAKEHHEEGDAHESHGHDYDEEDMAHMHKMYKSMSPGELGVHHEAIKKCMGTGSSADPHGPEGKVSDASKEQDAMTKADGCGGEMGASAPNGPKGALSPASKEQDDISKTETGKVESCEPKKTPGTKSPASKADGVQMEKSENKEVDLLKSELEAEKAKGADLKKNFEAVQEFLTKLAKKTAPQGKAITSLDVIAKTETLTEEKSLSKKEITEVLNKKTADPSLKKSDRDAVTSYYLNGQVNVNSISHLLK